MANEERPAPVVTVPGSVVIDKDGVVSCINFEVSCGWIQRESKEVANAILDWAIAKLQEAKGPAQVREWINGTVTPEPFLDAPAGVKVNPLDGFRCIGVKEEIPPGQHWICVTKGMVNWFVVEMWMNNEDAAAVFPEPWQKVGGYHATEFDAACEAFAVAKLLELPYFLPQWTDEQLERRKAS